MNEEEINYALIRKNVELFVSMLLNRIVEEHCSKNEIAHENFTVATVDPPNDTGDRQYIEDKASRQNEEKTEVQHMPYMWKRSKSMPLLSTYGFNNATKYSYSGDDRTGPDTQNHQAQPDLDNESVSQVRCHINDDVALISYKDYKSLSLVQALKLPPMVEVDLTSPEFCHGGIDVADLDRMIDEAGKLAHANSKMNHHNEAGAKHKSRDMTNGQKNKQIKKGLFSRVRKLFKRLCCRSVQEEECVDVTLDTFDDSLIITVDTYL